jgi:predicted nuclease with TOPRIM domain
VEVNNAAISGMQEALKFYTELSTDTKKRLEEVVKERNDLSDKIEQQGKELAQVKAELLRLSVSLCYNMSCEIRKNYQAEEKPKPKTKPKKDEANK